MKVVRSQEELRSLHNEIDNEAFYSSLETDVKTIEEYYESVSEEYGPLIIIIDDGEQSVMEEKYPLIKELEPEEYVSIYEDNNTKIERTCYILTDAGYIVYIVGKKA